MLIKGTEIIGQYPTEEEAYEDAVDQFGVGPFMIREVREHDEVLFIPVLGIWHEGFPLDGAPGPLDLSRDLGEITMGEEG